MEIRLALVGDVMLARAIDQVQRSSVAPELREPAVTDARDYIALAERASGTIPRGVSPSYVWGDAAEVIRGFAPHATVVNLETSLTTSDEFASDKGIHYRAHPDNVAVLDELPEPIVSLANNHVLDLGTAGLRETLRTVAAAEIPHSGAGETLEHAQRPAIREVDRECAATTARVATISCCAGDSGVGRDWSAGGETPGVFRLGSLGEDSLAMLGEVSDRARHGADAADSIVVLSIHWGGNWGYEVAEEKRSFARAVVDRGIADVVHGHSSHHPRPFELREEKLILYGCGDFINDYEGIGGHEEFQPWFSLLYLATLDSRSGRLADFRIVPFRMDRFRLQRATAAEADAIARRLSRENPPEGPGVEPTPDGLFIVPQ
ncbi:MAG: CapA family protein [Spirochaetota bacterium]